MKKVLSIITITAAVAVVMVACKGGSTTTPTANKDTVGLAAFNAWKLQTEIENTPVANTSTKTSSPKKVTSTSGTMTSTSSNDAQVAKKKGWSKGAKGAVIGGASGAVLGAVINKRNRVAGGILGGIIGGGVGYGVGHHKDKKDGRN